MKKKKGLIFDGQKCFSRFLKYEFGNDFNFDVYRNFENFDDILQEYTLIIFVIREDEELLDLMRIYKKGIPVIVCTVHNELILKLKIIDDIFLIDLSKLRSQIKEEFKSYFNLM